MRRDDVASSLIRRHFGTICPLGEINASDKGEALFVGFNEWITLKFLEPQNFIRESYLWDIILGTGSRKYHWAFGEEGDCIIAGVVA